MIGSSVALRIVFLEGTGQGLPLVLGAWAQPHNGAGSSRCRSIPALSWMSPNPFCPGRRIEAEFRTVSGRAYYAVYGTMTKRLCGAKHFLSPSRLFGKAGRHAELLSAIHRGIRGFQDVGAQSGRLYAKRTRSDYKCETPVTREDAKRAVDDAKWVVSRLGKIRDKDFSSFPILPRR